MRNFATSLSIVFMELSTEFSRFVLENRHSDVGGLRLKYAGKRNMNFDVDFAITQVDCRQRAKNKLFGWIENENFLFHSTLSSEQSTSELIAEFHASLIPKDSTVLDMTCGLGIDSMTFARYGANVKSIEINQSIAEIVSHNIQVCGIKNIELINADSIDYLNRCNEQFGVIFVDPARRGSHNQRTFAFEDCTPDIIANFELIKRHCRKLIIKASPMLDITQIVRSLKYISDIWIISIKNECKEILIRVDFVNMPERHAIIPINFFSKEEKSEMKFYSDRENKEVSYITELPDDDSDYWLYEPNSSFMKTMAWDFLSDSFSALRKLNQNTHIFISDKLYSDFPGRKLKIKKIISLKELKTHKGLQSNIIIRNAPLSINDIKKQYKISDGGSNYLYICRSGQKNKVIAILCE